MMELKKFLKNETEKEKKEIKENLKEVYNISDKYMFKISSYFSAIKEQGEKRKFIDEFLKSQNLPLNKESRFAIIKKLVFLKNTSLSQYLKKENFSEEKIIKIKENAYLWVKDFYETNFENFIKEIEEKNLLTKFYLEVLKGANNVGKKMNLLEVSWKKHIQKINKELEKKFKEKEKIMNYLRENNLLDKGHYALEANRCYSVLVNENKKYVKKSYFEAFEEVKEVLEELKKFKENLENLEDEIYNQKKEYINYLESLIVAFSEKNTDRLIEKWADVDSAWMKITTPFQIGHPLEYYEDNYRKAVSIEWDLRLKNFNLPESERVEKIKKMYKQFFEKFEKENFNEVYEKSMQNLKRVQLYLSKPILFYGSELNGLFSAQVVPNDLEISKIYGKKIFGFSDMQLKQTRESPFTKLSKEIFEAKYVKESREFLYNETKKWHRVYDLATIGHEYGHVLWLNDDTEIEMNKTGNFKNIEEFKATIGGLLSFFVNEESEIKKEFLREVVSRAIGLVAWKEEEKYRPYYCESLIHLTGFFESGILSFNKEKIIFDFDSKDKYDKIKKWHFETYEKLAKNYLEKKDASEFLYEYLEDFEKTYVPKNKKLKEITDFFYKKYQELGNQIDESVKKEDYIKN